MNGTWWSFQWIATGRSTGQPWAGMAASRSPSRVGAGGRTRSIRPTRCSPSRATPARPRPRRRAMPAGSADRALRLVAGGRGRLEGGRHRLVDPLDPDELDHRPRLLRDVLEIAL